MSAVRARRLGLVVNPIAGMGGRVGLKGTDDVVAQARALGARPSAPGRARAALRTFARLLGEPHAPPPPRWLTGGAALGARALRDCGLGNVEIVHAGGGQTSGRDTRAAVAGFVAGGVDLVVFCGGDGTARDVCAVCGRTTPVLGIPAGVKMYSGVFAATPDGAGRLLLRYVQGRLELVDADVLDLDEARYRAGEWLVRLFATARTPYEPTLTPGAKLQVTEEGDAQAKADIADTLLEWMRELPEALFLLGPGSTVQAVGRALHIDKTLLGIDAVRGGEVAGRDLDERGILALLARCPERRLIVSPIGAQGFVLGRGNLQLSPPVLRAIGVEHVTVVATPAKLARTAVLRFDTGDAALDGALGGKGYLSVVTGYRRRRMVPVQHP